MDRRLSVGFLMILMLGLFMVPTLYVPNLGHDPMAPVAGVRASTGPTVIAFTIHNTQSTGTGTYDQLVVVDSNTYNSLLATNLSNEAWQYPNSTFIDSWIESNASKTATATYTWLRLFNIPATSSQTVDLLIYSPTSTFELSPNGPSGEAPQLSRAAGGSYAQWDDGNLVFPDYTNFSGSSLNTNLLKVTQTAPDTYTINNGLTIGAYYPGGGKVSVDFIAASAPQTYASETYGNISAQSSQGCGGPGGGPTWQAANSGTGLLISIGSISASTTAVGMNSYNGANGCGTQMFTVGNQKQIVGLWYNSSSSLWTSRVNYTGLVTLSSNTPSFSTSVYTAVQAQYGSYSNFTWFRQRTLPPNGVMPTATAPMVPGAPTNVVVTAVSTVSLHATWTNPSGTLVGNNVSVYAHDCSTLITGPTAIATATSTNILSLSAGTSYCIRISASNASGAGPLSTGTRASINATLPSTPTSPTVTVASTTSLTVSWTNPAGQNLTGDYILEFSGASCGTLTGHLATSVTTSHTFTGLTTGTPYSYEIEANTSGGGSAPTACVTGTPTNPPPAAPTLVNVTAESTVELFVTWVASSGGGLIGTNVSVYNPAGSVLEAGPYPFSGSTTSANIGSLTAGTTYCLRVSSTNLSGEGAFSSCTRLSINTTLPTAPGSPMATPLSTTSINVSWTIPGVQNLTGGYIFRYRLAGCVPANLQLAYSQNPQSTYEVLTGLMPSTTYSFEINLKTEGGQGANTSCVAAKTFDPAPGTPTGLTAMTSGAFSIQLAWTEPAGNITGTKIVEYAGLICGGSPLTTLTEPAGSSFNVGGLSANTSYSFTVAASTTGGYGSASTCAGNTTRAGPPPPFFVLGTPWVWWLFLGLIGLSTLVIFFALLRVRRPKFSRH